MLFLFGDYMDQLAQYIKQSSINQLLNLDDTLHNVPFVLFLKDKKGNHLDGNNNFIKLAGLKKIEDLIGLSDFDLVKHDQAVNVKAHDAEIIRIANAKVFLETATFRNGTSHQALSYKSPLRLRSKKIIGILGVAFLLDEKKLFSPNKFFPNLTKRQSECLYYLSHGMTLKEIARELMLSPRTVEHYLEAAKIKWNCISLNALIKKFHATQTN